MFIVKQSRRGVVNANLAVKIELETSCIQAIFNNETKITLGSYKTEERANEVFQEMLKELFPQQTLVFQNMEVSEESLKEIQKQGLCAIVANTDDTPKLDIVEPRVYYMPEK